MLAPTSPMEALDRSVVIFDWEHYIGKTLNEGQCGLRRGHRADPPSAGALCPEPCHRIASMR